MLAYCDYIAHRIKEALEADVLRGDDKIALVEGVAWHLHPLDGYMLSTKKTIKVTDGNFKRYKVTVEEID